MPRKITKQKDDSADSDQPVQLDFESILQSAQVLSRDEVSARVGHLDGSTDYDPVGQTAEYMRRAIQVEESWETTIQHARDHLLTVDARELYLDFLTDLTNQINSGAPRAAYLVKLLDLVAVRGLGMDKSHIHVPRLNKGGTAWHIDFRQREVRDYLDSHIVGKSFLSVMSAREPFWHGPTPLIGSSDISQHRSAVPIPARFFKRSVPFVLNNAAGALYKIQDGQPHYDNLFNPKPNEDLLRWMLIDPSYQDELEPEDYERCLASAMDVGQYKFDREYLMKADRRPPDIIFRDGSLFPQDAFLDNFVFENRRGDFIREAIRELLDCLSYARQSRRIYCGVSKSVQLKVFSAVVDWYIEKHIDQNWAVSNYTLNDGQAMSLLLASPSFVGNNLSQVISTCLIKRSFTTRAALNSKVKLQELEPYLDDFQERHQDIDITPYRSLCDTAHLYMFFLGHSKSPQQQLPRYEFFHTEALGEPWVIAEQILGALGHCSLMDDHDHSFMADSPITYLLPSVTQQAHLLSKDVGKYIDSATGQWIMARYHSYLPK